MVVRKVVERQRKGCCNKTHEEESESDFWLIMTEQKEWIELMRRVKVRFKCDSLFS